MLMATPTVFRIGGGGFVAPNKGGVGRTSYGYKGNTPTFSNSYGR